jgi:hypothetical protein
METSSTLNKQGGYSCDTGGKKTSSELNAKQLWEHYIMQAMLQQYTQAYHDQGNLTKDGANQAMDTFHRLDNRRWADYKV